MNTVRDVMTRDVVWVSPSTRVKVAITFMKTQHIGALPVVQMGGAVDGLVTYQSILGEPQDVAVAEVMERDYVTVESDATVYDAAELMNKTGSSHLLVFDDSQLVGIVSRGDLMPELGKTFDPLTELPWSDAIRDWAMDALKRGHEISVIFFDLDHYGLFNKRHGHVVGDNVLKEVAKVFKKGIDPELDLACRYGGDEFTVVSLRRADEAVDLAEILQTRISSIQVEGLTDGVSGTYGMSGGRRTKEREDIHYAATIDDLITRASKECTARKPHRIEKPEAAPAPQPQAAPAVSWRQPEGARLPRLRIQTVGISTTGPEATVSVTLARAGREFTRTASGYVVGGRNTLRLVAEATAGAACKSLAPGHGIAIEEVFLQSTNSEEEIVTVVAVFISPRSSIRHVGSAVVKRGDPYRATAAATLAAVNRQIDSAPMAEVEQGETSAN